MMKKLNLILTKYYEVKVNEKEYTDITYNGQYLYAVSRKKKKERLNINLSNEEVGDFLSHIANILGKNFNTLNPFLDISFLTYRLSAVHPIIAKERKGGVYTFSLRIYQKELVIDTSNTSYCSKDVFELFKKLIENNISILISGKVGSGKTEYSRKYFVYFNYITL